MWLAGFSCRLTGTANPIGAHGFPRFLVGFSYRLTGTANPIGEHEFPRFLVGFSCHLTGTADNPTNNRGNSCAPKG
jgi:hypothetical protein